MKKQNIEINLYQRGSIRFGEIIASGAEYWIDEQLKNSPIFETSIISEIKKILKIYLFSNSVNQKNFQSKKIKKISI